MKSFEIVQIFALVFWSFQLAPQALENYKAQSTGGLSSLMMLCWSLGSVCTGIYCIGAKFSVLFIIQPNLFLLFSIICWSQCFYHDKKHGKHGIIYGALLTLVLCLVEAVGGYFLLHSSYTSSDWPFILIGSLSTSMFGLGFIPQYYTFYQSRRVDGISLLFLSIDMTGSVLSIIALALQDSFEPISATCYIVVFVCDLMIVVLHFLLPCLMDVQKVEEVLTVDLVTV